jgi:PAS domain S-box-containing protein
MKWKLKSKMFLFILSTTVLIYIAALGSISITFRERALKDIMEIADSHAKEFAFLVQSRLNEYFGAARTLSHTFEKMDSLTENQRESITEMILRNVLVRNPEYIAAFLQWELQYIDPDYHKPYGRKRKSLYRDAGQIVEKDEILDIEGDDTSGIYYKVKSSGKEYFTRPYYYTYQHEQALPSDEPLGEEAILEATIIIPIMKNDRFIGLTGVDIPLTKFQIIIDELESFKNSYTFLIANNGHFVTHPDSKFINRAISDFSPADDINHRIKERIRQGESFSFITKDFPFYEGAYVSFVPFQTGRTDSPWSIGIVVPMEEILKEANTPFYLSVSTGILGFFALAFVIWIISSNITKPLKSTTDLFKKLAGGQINDAKRLIVSTNDEIGDMTHSANILLDGLNRTVAFAKKIGNSDLDADYQPLSPDDTLGKSLVDMRNQLKESRKAIQSQAELLIEKNRELEKLSIVASETDNAIMIMDWRGNLEWINEGLTRLYGYTYEQFVSEIGHNILNFSMNPKIETIFKKCISEKKSIVYTSHEQTRSGKRIWAQTTLTPILDRDNEVIMLIAIDSDISKIKLAESKISAQRDNLEKLNAAKDKFFSIIAHDLKNPFSVLLSVTTSLSEGFDDLSETDKNMSINRINKSVTLLYNLLENLLQWSMSQTGRLKYSPEKNDLYLLVFHNISLLKMNAEKRNIKLINNLKDGLSVFVDMDMINTVIRNLISNAIKFNVDGGTIEINALQKNNMIEIEIKDTGIGLTDEDIEKLFRIDIKNTSIGSGNKEKGTGIGLIICKEFVEKNGGQIRVSSEIGKGSNFCFTVPIFKS